MNRNESIDDMITKFTKTTNGIISLGDEIDNDQKVRKVISGSSIILGSQVHHFEGAQ